jgi:hypothetical protein
MLLRPLFLLMYTIVSGIGAVLDRVERAGPQGANILPMNLMLTARRPA